MTAAARPVGAGAGVRGFADLGRARVIGVLNVTPDSFSDGGRYLEPERAVTHGRALAAAGADIVDVGGESTRPGADRVAVGEELARVLPVVASLTRTGVRVSVDTSRATVAEPALDAGAAMVNDVTGGSDPDLLALVAARGCPYVLMHSRGPSRDMTERASYGDVVTEVVGELAARLDTARAAGVAPEQLLVDPGLGFAKTADHNWALLRHLAALRALGRPIVVGASRKSFLGALLAGPSGRPRPPVERDAASTAVAALAAAAGVWAVRVHDAAAAADAVRVAARWAGSPP